MTTLAVALFDRRRHLDAERERALLIGLHCADANEVPHDLSAAFVADREHHRIFVCTATDGTTDGASHAQWRGRQLRTRPAVDSYWPNDLAAVASTAARGATVAPARCVVQKRHFNRSWADRSNRQL